MTTSPAPPRLLLLALTILAVAFLALAALAMAVVLIAVEVPAGAVTVLAPGLGPQVTLDAPGVVL